MPLTPLVEGLLQSMADAGGPAISDLPPETGREVYRMMHQDNQKAQMHEVKDMQAGTVPIRIYHPVAEDHPPCIVFYHGGGWVIGDLETHDASCRMLAEETGYAVIAVDYRLAPEPPYPAPVNDAYDAFCWIHKQAKELNIDSERLAVAGDSAGGNLAAVVSLRARDESGPKICHQLLIYPVTDAAMDSASYKDNGEGYMLSEATMTWFFDHYATKDVRENPFVSPLKAESLEGLPPATIFTAEFDPLRDEGEAFASRLKASGVKTHLKRFDGQIHGFFTMTDVMPEARQSAQIAAEQMSQDLA
jgi:acetyl esterase